MMLHFLLEDSQHRKMILERIVGRIYFLIETKVKSTGDNENLDGIYSEQNRKDYFQADHSE